MNEENKTVSILNWIGQNLAWDYIRPVLSLILPLFQLTQNDFVLPVFTSYPFVNFIIYFLFAYGLIGFPTDVLRWYRKFTEHNLKLIIGQTYENKTIKLDKKHYLECNFSNCTIRWNGGPYNVNDCKKRGSIGFETSNSTVSNTIRLLKSLDMFNAEFADRWQSLPNEYFQD